MAIVMNAAIVRITLVLFVLLLIPAVLAGQDQPPEHGMVEAGARTSWGDVYGRPDLPFRPALKTSNYNEYRDLRDGFFIRRFRLNMGDLSGSKYFVDVQSDKSFYRDQSYLATFGAWSRFKVQIRYDEIPHLFSNTTRTLYTQTGRGVLTIPLLTRSTLQDIAATAPTTLPSTIQTQLVPSMAFIVPGIERRAGTGLFAYNITPDVDVLASFSREHQSGSRPLGLIFNSSPSASLGGGYGAEVPEPIDYFTNTVRLRAELARERWGIQLGYLGSFFQNHTGVLIFDNPFRTTDCVAPRGTGECLHERNPGASNGTG